MTGSPPLPRFELAAAELRRQEFARLSDAVPLPLAALRSLTSDALRAEVALMLERLGYTVITGPGAHDFAVSRDGRKYIVTCAPPADKRPTKTVALARLHDAVVAATAQAGFYVATRDFTPAARDYAATAPIRLVTGEQLAVSIKKSKADMPVPETYKAMCRQCGDVVRHRLDRAAALPCANGHPVAPTIARAALTPWHEPAVDASPPVGLGRKPKPFMTAKAKIRAHNRAVRKRAIRMQREGE